MEQVNVLVTERDLVIGQLIRDALISRVGGKEANVVVVGKILNRPTEGNPLLKCMLRNHDSKKSEPGQVDLSQRFDVALFDGNIGNPGPAALVPWLSPQTFIVDLSGLAPRTDALFNAIEKVIQDTSVPRKYFALRHKTDMGAFLLRTLRIETEQAFRWPQELDASQRLADLQYFYQLLGISSSSGSA